MAEVERIDGGPRSAVVVGVPRGTGPRPEHRPAAGRPVTTGNAMGTRRHR